MNRLLPPTLDAATLVAVTGSVAESNGVTVAAVGMPAPVGAIVSIERAAGGAVEAEVIGFRGDQTLLAPLASLEGVRRGSPVRLLRTAKTVKVGPALLGRVVNARGVTVDDRPKSMLTERLPIERAAPLATLRPRIDTRLGTGVRAIDAMLACGRGQRLGVFAGSGVGKSVLMGMMARNTVAEVSVIALIGERGREVNEFIERDLGPEGLARSVVVAATSDEPAVLRVQAAYTATAIAEYFRDSGRDVLLVMDSLTRFALAQREIGLAAGEPPTTRGFPPSTFSLLPKLVERAGRSSRGSITAFYSVLVEGDDENEPVADAVRGLLDGHVWMSRRLAQRGHYPAIDVLRSISRLANEVTGDDERQARQTLRELLAVYAEHEDLISIGAYRRGANRTLDVAVEMREEINGLLRQEVREHAPVEEVRKRLLEVAGKCRSLLGGATAAAAGGQASPAAGAAAQDAASQQPKKRPTVIKRA